MATKSAAREALEKLGLPKAQADAVNRAIGRATRSSSIDIVRGEAGVVIVKISRPGRDGFQVFEHTIGANGTKSVVQKAYDAAGNLVHIDPKTH